MVIEPTISCVRASVHVMFSRANPKVPAADRAVTAEMPEIHDSGGHDCGNISESAVVFVPEKHTATTKMCVSVVY